MFTRLEVSIAWRYLRSRRGSRFLSLISVIAIGGVTIGVSALIVIIGVMNGMQRDLRDKILVGSPDVYVVPYGVEMKMPNWAPLLDRVSKFSGVVAARPYVQAQGLVRPLHADGRGAEIMGIDLAADPTRDVTTVRQHLVIGEFRFERAGSSLPGAVLGNRLATQINALVGDTILMFGLSGLVVNASTGTIIPTADSAVVTGLFETGLFEYDNARLYVDLPTAQHFAGFGGDVSGIEIRTRNRDVASTVALELREALGDVRTLDWQDSNQSLFQALKLEKLGMTIILLLVVVVAAFNIVSTLTMSVTDKTREIGILRAMGLPAKSIMRVFLWQGVVIGAVGTLGGTVLGVIASLLIDAGQVIKLDPSVYSIDHLPVALQPFDVLLIIVSSVGIAALATLYPARQAARLYPVDAIRHE